MTDSWSSRLSEYMDGDLSAGDLRDLENHLAHCGECRRELDDLRHVVGRLDTAPDREPEQDLWPSLSRRLSDQEQVPSERHGWWSPFRSMATTLRRGWVPVAGALAAALVLATVSVEELRTSLVQFLLDPTVIRVRLDPWTEETPGPGPDVLQEPDPIATYRAMAKEWQDLVDVTSLPEPVATSVTADLESFDRAIEETLRALEEHPGDQEIELHLIRTLRAQARLLSRIEVSTEAL